MKLSQMTDLTRWNRAGLSRFRYIDGNAVTYLETLRQQLAHLFDQGNGPSWQELVTRFPELADETRRETRKRLLDQYYDERRDYAWEILRSFARSAHVLGEYLDAYANEAYLPTAVEWDNLRKLVGLLGYRPAPPASAQTQVALLFKTGESGEVAAGFALKNQPAAGAPTVIFETADKLQGSADLNRLYLLDWDKNPTPIGSGAAIDFPLETLPEGLSVGDLGVLARPGKGVPVVLSAIDTEAPALSLQPLAGQPDGSFRYHNTELHLQPGLVAAPLANGDGSALLQTSVNLAEGEILFGKQDGNWVARRVEKIAAGHAQLSGGAPVEGEQLHKALSLNRQDQPKLAGGPQVYVLPHGDEGSRDILVDSDLNAVAATIRETVITDEDGDAADNYFYITGPHDERIYYPEQDYSAVVKQAAVSEIRFSGKASDLASGGWALVTKRDGSQAAYPISAIAQEEEWFEVQLQGSVSPLRLLRGDFKHQLRPRDHQVNNQPAWSSSSSDAVSILELADPELADQLQLGQRMLCAGDDYAVSLQLKDIETLGGGARLHLEPAFHLEPEAAGLTRHGCSLYGNVVAASHGETQPEKILGNGDASRTHQRFGLPADDISWVADAGFASGVRADLSLRVGERAWEQVEALADSGPEDHHYQVEVDEDGVLWACFGDGRNGRRLPTGADNVRVRYRTGYGEDGNLAPQGLTKIARPNPLVEGFAAPLAASGGADKESSESLRESAPATVLALQRAVSLDDFTHLAAHHSMVWQARAFEKMPDRPARPLIEVVVVAAGGATFSTGAETGELIRSYLAAHAAPGTPVTVVSYQPLSLALSLSIMVDQTAYDQKQVEQAVREHLETNLALDQRRLGQPLFRSEVIALLEQVEGVENGHCKILDTPYAALGGIKPPRLHKADDGGIRRISVQPNQLLYLDPDAYPLDISVSDYEI